MVVNKLQRLYFELRDLRTIMGTRDYLKYCVSFLKSLPAGIREKSLLPADRNMEGWFEFQVAGDSIQLKATDAIFGLVREILARKCYYSEYPPAFHKWERVLDLGANTGVFTVLAASKADRVIAVEAQKGFQPQLNEVLDRNDFSNVEVVNSIIGSTTGVYSSLSKFRESPDSVEQTPEETTMPEIIDRFDIEQIDFLKADIEGSEFSLFEDASWIDRVDQLGMEVHLEYGDPSNIKSELVSRGFDVTLLDEDLNPTEKIDGELGYLQARSL